MNYQTPLIGLVIFSLVFFSGCLGKKELKPSPPSEATLTTLTKTTPPLEEVTTSLTITSLPTTLLEAFPFSKLLALGEPLGYTVSYDVTTITPKGEETLKQKYFVKGGKTRVDIMITLEGGKAEGRVYLLGKEGYLCTKTKEKWICLGEKTREEAEKEAGISEKENNLEDFEREMEKVKYAGTQEIAGVIAYCYKITPKSGEVKMCFHPQHYLVLLIESKEYRMIATSVNLTPPHDEEFELPAKPLEVSNLPTNLPF